jgi:hypothetical protein
VSGNPPEFSGSLITSNAPQGLRVAAKKVGTREILDRFKGLKIARYGGGVGFQEDWPSFPGTNELLDAISTFLNEEVRTNAAQFLSNGYQMGWEGLKARSTTGMMNWESSANVSISWCSPQLVSLYQDCWTYTGGAHHNEAISVHNFISSSGKPKEISLDDLFLRRSDWQEKICAMCARELRLQQASDFTGDPPRQLKVNELSAFTLDDRGISFHFSPYEVGSFAEGSYDVFIAWDELRPLLDTGGPIRLIDGALKKVP